jgi:hypothetical protein
MKLIKHALDVSKQYPNFPLSGKGPAIAKSDGWVDSQGRGGPYAATRDPKTLKKMYGDKAAPDYRIGVPCGALSGICVIDVDTYKDDLDDEWYARALAAGLNTGRVHAGNGLHYIFQWPEGLGCPVPASGIEVKGEGGYVGWPGSGHYKVVADIDPPEMPVELLDLVTAQRGVSGSHSRGVGLPNDTPTDELVRRIEEGEDYHPALLPLSMRIADELHPDGTRLDANGIEAILRAIVEASEPSSAKRKERRQALLDNPREIRDIAVSAFNKAKRPDWSDVAEKLGGGSRFFRGPLSVRELDSGAQEQPLEPLSAEIVEGPKRRIPNAPPGLVGEIATYHDKNATYVAPEYGIAAGLMAVSTLMGNRYVIDTGTHETATNLFMIVMGQTGTGKEKPRGVVDEVLQVAGDDDVSKEIASEPAFHKALTNRPRLLWMPDEFGRFLDFAGKSSGAHASTVLTFAMKAYGLAMSRISGKVYADRKNDLAPVERPYVNILATSTQETIEKALTTMAITEGSLNRMLTVSFEGKRIRRSAKRTPMSKSLRSWIHTASEAFYLSQVVEGKQKGGRITIKPDKAVLDALEAFNEEIDRRMDDRNVDNATRSLLSRIVENTIRVAGVLAFGEAADPFDVKMTKAHFDWARDFCEACSASLSKLAENLSDSDHGRDHNRVLQYIHDRWMETREDVSQRDVIRKFRSLKKRDREEIIDTLIESGDIRKGTKSPDGGGRPSVVYQPVIVAIKAGQN